MNESNQNFDELKRLLKLKRHEVPPPGYFNNFSGEVVSRIRAGETDGSGDRLHAQVPWLASLLRIFEVRPGVIGALATSLCLLLLIGVVMADRPDSMPAGGILATSAPAAESAPAPSLASVMSPVATVADNSGIAVSTNPVVSLQPAVTLFSQQQNPLFQSASFAPGR